MGKHALTTICLVLAACGGDDSGGGGGSSDAAVSDTGAGSADAPAAACLSGTYDIDKAWFFTQGPYAIAGTVTLPAALQSGRGIQLNIIEVSPDPGNSIDFAIVSTTKSTVTYRARALVDGTWKICMRADVDGNNMLNDVGVDYTGCYDGTVASPITSTTSATPIVLGGMCRSGMDFGLGLYN